MEILWPFWVVFALIGVVLSTLLLVFYRKSLFGWKLLHQKRFLDSSTVVSNRTLFMFRLVAFIYIATVWTWSLCNEWPRVGRHFSFYTVWNYTILGAYFFWAVISPVLWRLSPTASHFARQTRFYIGHMRWVLFQIILTNTLLVDVTVWTTLFPHAVQQHNPGLYLNFDSINMHAANLVWVAIEFVLCNIPFQIGHLFFVLLLPAVYCVYAWVWHATTSFPWQYFFLNTAKESNGLFYLGLFIAHTVFYSLWYFLSRVKLRRYENLRHTRLLEDQYLSSEEYGDFLEYPHVTLQSAPHNDML